MERFANGAIAALADGIDDSETTLTIDDASAFPATGNFRIVVDSELMLVTAVSSETFTVTRGVEGTTAASHSESAEVRHVLTAGALDAYRSDTISTGAYSSRPSTPGAGTLYLANNNLIYRGNGSTWDSFGPIKPFTPLDNGDFSWVNQGSAVLTQYGNVYNLRVPADNSVNLRGRFKAAPSTPYTVTMACLFNSGFNTTTWFGLGFRDSATARATAFRIFTSTASRARVTVTRWGNNTTASSNPINYSGTPFHGSWLAWLRVRDDGTDFTFSLSADGKNFMDFYSEGRTAWTANPDSVGFMCHAQSTTSIPASLSVFHWLEE